MRRLLVAGAFCLWIGWTSGCVGAKKGTLTNLPDPVFAAAGPRPAPAPASPVGRPPRARSAGHVPPGWIPPGGIHPRWSCIVIHHSASESGGAETFDRYHRNVREWSELGYHFVIGNGTDTQDGEIEVGSRWTKQKHGAHCKTPDGYYNNHGIGICLVGNFNHHPPSRAQKASLARLIGFLVRECGIDLSHVHTHRGVTHRTECPGAQFSLAALKSRLGSEVTAVSHAR